MTGERVAAADVEIARKLAALYDVPWTEVSLPPRSGEDLSRYTALRSGRITLSNADILTFFDRLRAEFGPITYLTGDGGDKLLPDPSPISDLLDGSVGTDADAEAMAAFLTEHHARLSPADAAAIAGLPEGTIEAATARRIRHYPESGSDAHLRFLFAERAYNLLFEGEERNRCSFWSTSPFYSLPFVRYAMNVPRRQKRDYRLYGDFLRALSPDGRLLSVRNPAFDARPGTARHTLTAGTYRTLQRYPALLERVLPVARAAFGIEEHTDRSPIERRTIREQFDNSDAIGRVLDPSAIEEALSEERGYDRREVLTILTVTALIDARSDGRSVLDTDPDRLFDRVAGADDAVEERRVAVSQP
jgi:asparagine synthase (glutamine-hydrolysing)